LGPAKSGLGSECFMVSVQLSSPVRRIFLEWHKKRRSTHAESNNEGCLRGRAHKSSVSARRDADVLSRAGSDRCRLLQKKGTLQKIARYHNTTLESEKAKARAMLFMQRAPIWALDLFPNACLMVRNTGYGALCAQSLVLRKERAVAAPDLVLASPQMNSA
jgi:hypothetical protein